jgi:hypothetical protein
VAVAATRRGNEAAKLLLVSDGALTRQLCLWVVEIIFFAIETNRIDNVRNRCIWVSFSLEINYIAKGFHIEKLPHIFIFCNLWQMRPWNKFL